MNDNVLELIRRRRTVRRFTQEEVPEEQIAALIEAAFYAPTYLNRRPWHFLVVRDKAVQQNLGSILGVRPYVQEASAVIVLLGDPEISSAWQLDLSAAAQNILIAATSMGLGAAWVGNPHAPAWGITEGKIREVLDIPSHIGILGLIAVGYPAQTIEPHSKEERWDVTRVHYGKFSHLKSEWAKSRLDDLTRIEGIGPKVSDALRGAGIVTFAQLAATDASKLREITRRAGIIGNPASWPRQAKLAAEGNWDALQGLQREIKGGRRAS